MSTPRIEWTPRLIIGSILVSIPAVVFVIGMTFLALPDASYHSARQTETFTWDAGSAPAVAVDLDGGSITVAQGTGGRVEAKLTKLAVTKVSQAAADAALGGVRVVATRDGGAIRLKTTLAAPPGLAQFRADLELRVPPESSVDLRTAHGSVSIGKVYADPYGSYLIDSPVTLRSVRARDEGETDLGIEVDLAPRPPALPPTRLDLLSRHGSVAIRGDNVLITAEATGGAVQFTGRPAPGTHHLQTGPYAPHVHQPGQLVQGLLLKIPADCPVAIAARSQSGPIACEFPGTPASSPQSTTFASPPDINGDVRLDLTTVDGPIEIRRTPGREAPAEGHNSP